MSNELNYVSGITGQTITAKTMLLGSTVLSGAISLTEIGTTGIYSGNMSGSSGRYSVLLYVSGVLVDSGQIDWDGSAEITNVSINSKTVNLPANPASQTKLDLVEAKTTQMVFTGANLNSNAQVVADKTGYSVSTLSANTITAASIAAAALNGKGDWNIGKTGYNVSSINAGVITPTVAPNLDAAISTRMATFTYIPPDNTTIGLIAGYTDSIESRLPIALVGGKMDSTSTDISSLATASAVTAVQATANTINSNTSTLSARIPSALVSGKIAADVDLSAITSKLPTGGAKIAGEGTTVKNLDQLPTSSTIVAGIFSYVVENSKTFAQILRINFAVLTGKTTGVGTSTNIFMDNANTKARVTATFDAAKNRTNITLDGN
jgi:hypothetical protein